jgi:hypothetical protein
VKNRALVFAALLSAAVPAAAIAAEKTVTANGVVEGYSAADHAFAVKPDSGPVLRFVWTKETKFNGVVANGARVTVRYTPQTDGPNVAQTVGVLK